MPRLQLALLLLRSGLLRAQEGARREQSRHQSGDSDNDSHSDIHDNHAQHRIPAVAELEVLNFRRGVEQGMLKQSSKLGQVGGFVLRERAVQQALVEASTWNLQSAAGTAGFMEQSPG